LSWTHITSELQAVTLAAVRKLLSAHESEHIYALALYTDEDGSSVVMAANTEEACRAHLASQAKDEPNTPEDEIYYRWASSEWALEGWESDQFSGVNALIQQQDQRDLDAYFSALIEAMTMALAGVKQTLDDTLADITVFVTVTDDDRAEEIENASAGRINATDLATAFQSRYG
jgi:hypothetical protein